MSNYFVESLSTENQESKPDNRYPLQTETEYTPLIEGREKWLDTALHTMPTPDDTIIDMSMRRSFPTVLEQWKQDLPDQSTILAELRNRGWSERLGGETKPKSLVLLIDRAMQKHDDKAVNRYQQFGKALVHHYWQGESGRIEPWQALPEGNRKSIRYGEMAVLAADSLKIQEELKHVSQPTARHQKMAQMLEHYSKSTDIPDFYKRKYIHPLIEKVLGKDPERQEQQWRQARR